MYKQFVCGVGWMLAGVALAGSTTSALAEATVHVYRYELSLRSGDSEYREEVPTGVPAIGPSYEVERDQMDRIVKETDFENGKPVSSREYHYKGLQRFDDGENIWIDRQLTATEDVHRNAKGLITRIERHTAGGELTAYAVRDDVTDHVEVRSYTADGRPVLHVKGYYSSAGVLIRRLIYSSPESDEAGFTEAELDARTGKTTSSRQIEDGKLRNTKKYIYADGNLKRVDAFDARGTLFSVDAYEEGLLRKRDYESPQGVARELRYSYDERNWVAKSEIYSLGKLVCVLTYDRDSDGTIRRTTVFSPTGTLWAEYPPPIVMDVGRDGQAVGRSDALLHRTGNWW